MVSRPHTQIRLMGTDGEIDFLCKVDIETVSYFSLDCPNVRQHFDSLWANLTVKVKKFNHIDKRQISEFIAYLTLFRFCNF